MWFAGCVAWYIFYPTAGYYFGLPFLFDLEGN